MANSSSPAKSRASHALTSPDQRPNQSSGDQPAYHDVYSHPAVVAYAAAHPGEQIPKFGPYLLLQKLGEDEFGQVKLGLHSQWGEEVAVKLIHKGSVEAAARMRKVKREIEILPSLKHPNIVRLYEVIETDEYVGIVTEYASGGGLFDHMVAHRKLKEGDAAKLFSQLVSGVWYIHQKKIVHRNLKLENLLLDRHCNVIVTDFGFADRTDDLVQGSRGSPCYAAPELLSSEEPYVGSALDIWSCGVSLYAMLVGYLPFHDDPANPNGENINLLYKHIMNTPLSFPDYVSTDARDLLSMMLVIDPAHRATLVSVMAHSWLAPYGHVFQRTVDELENAAIEQQHMKCLAYQRQMKAQAAAGMGIEVPGKLTQRESKDDAGRKGPTPFAPSAPEEKTVDAGRDAIQAEPDDTSYREMAPSMPSRHSSSSTQVSSPKSRASHTVTTPDPRPNQNSGDQPAYHDVYSHPAAVAYTAAHPGRQIPKFGPYLLLQTLGEGGFGKVKLGLHSQWGEEVAVKLICKGSVEDAACISKVEREIEILRLLKHPNIIRLCEVIETDEYIGIVTEYASGGEVFDYMVAHRYLKERDAAKLFSQLVSGVWYIHQKKIVHRDLKLENLLLDRYRNVIIADFGFANRTDNLMQGSRGSPCYAAPELFFSEGPYVGSALDIWSCGVSLYAMLVGYLPFHDDPANPNGENINLLYEHMVKTPLSFPDYVSTDARDLLSMMLVTDPAHRATLVSVMAHPWLAPYGHVFQRTMDELENAAMEQQQMKRLAYQRQMKAQAAAGTGIEAPRKLTRRGSKGDVGRTRKDPPPSAPSAPEKKTVDTGRDTIQAEPDDTSYPEAAPSMPRKPSTTSAVKPLPAPTSAEANTSPTWTRPAIQPPQADSPTPMEQQPGSSPNNLTASRSPEQSSKRKGLSIDKMVLTKIFGITSTAEPVEDSGSQCQNQSQRPTTLQSLRGAISGAGKMTSKNSVLSPVGESGAAGEDARNWKKSRRNTLTTITGPFRSRMRKSKAPTPSPESFEKPITLTLTPTPSPALPQNASILDFGMGGIRMQASTNKARTLMQWFGARNQSRDLTHFGDAALSAPEATTGGSGRYAKIGPNAGFTLPHTIFPSFRGKWTSGLFVMSPNCHHHRSKNVNSSSILPGAFRICIVLFSAASSSMKLASWLIRSYSGLKMVSSISLSTNGMN